jgi:hypothetical protein
MNTHGTPRFISNLNFDEGDQIMSRRNGTRIVRNRRFQTQQRDQGLTRKPLTQEYLERYGNPNSRAN